MNLCVYGQLTGEKAARDTQWRTVLATQNHIGETGYPPTEE